MISPLPFSTRPPLATPEPQTAAGPPNGEIVAQRAANANCGASRGASAAVPPLAVRLRELRRARGLKQGALARRAGVSQSLVSAIERGRRGWGLRLAVFKSLADALGVTVAEFMGPIA